MISWIAELTNISPDKLLALLYLLINYPFAYILNYLIYFDLGPPIIKHLFVICVSLAILVNIFSWLCFQTLFLIVISYLVIKLAKNKDVGAIVTVFSLVYLGIFHFLRMFTSRESNHLTITTVTMLVVQRVTFYAYYIKEQRDKLKEYEDFEKPAIKYASFIEFLSYCLFFPVLLFGPSCDYAHYQQAISGLFVSTYIRDYGKGPSVRLNTIQPFFMSIFSLAAYVVVDFYFPFVYLLNTNYYDISGFCQYLFVFMINGWARRCLFYGCWCMTQSQANLCYIGFGGTKNESEDWKHLKNVDIFNHEFASNLKVALDSWNIKTTIWLRKVVYNRVPSHKVLCTFFVSAYWHGFYPHYYHTFFFGALLTHMSRMGRKKIRPYFVNTHYKIIYDIFTVFLTKFLTTYHTLLHLLLDFTIAYEIWKKLFFLGHLALIGMLLEFLPDKIQNIQ